MERKENKDDWFREKVKKILSDESLTSRQLRDRLCGLIDAFDDLEKENQLNKN